MMTHATRPAGATTIRDTRHVGEVYQSAAGHWCRVVSVHGPASGAGIPSGRQWAVVTRLPPERTMGCTACGDDVPVRQRGREWLCDDCISERRG